MSIPASNNVIHPQIPLIALFNTTTATRCCGTENSGFTSSRSSLDLQPSPQPIPPVVSFEPIVPTAATAKIKAKRGGKAAGRTAPSPVESIAPPAKRQKLVEPKPELPPAPAPAPVAFAKSPAPTPVANGELKTGIAVGGQIPRHLLPTAQRPYRPPPSQQVASAVIPIAPAVTTAIYTVPPATMIAPPRSTLPPKPAPVPSPKYAPGQSFAPARSAFPISELPPSAISNAVATATTTTTTTARVTTTPSPPTLPVLTAPVMSTIRIVHDPEEAISALPSLAQANAFSFASNETPTNVNFEKMYDSMQDYLETIPLMNTPGDLRTELLRHQKQALYWLNRQETKKEIKGAILADDMGLGKTLETIALMSVHKVACTLIICPVSTIAHWSDELKQHCLRGTFRVQLHYGNVKLRSHTDLDDYDNAVVITTYGTVASEYRDKPEKRVLSNIKWDRIVLDEAHLIKNRSTNTAKSICDLQSTYRLALTGTPIQNSLDDLYSLLLFLKFPDFPSYADFKAEIATPIKNKHATGFAKLQAVIRRVLLRRRKNQKLNGEPILSLPPVTSHSTLLTMGATEKTFYSTLETQSLRLFQELMEQGEKAVMKNYWHVLELLLRLRQACDHPFIVLMSMYKDKFRGVVAFKDLEEKYVDFIEDASETQQQILQSLASSMAANGPSMLCSLCEEEFVVPVVTPCKHFFCNACILDYLEENASPTCPTCAKPVAPSRLQDASTLIEELKAKMAAEEMTPAPLAPVSPSKGKYSKRTLPQPARPLPPPSGELPPGALRVPIIVEEINSVEQPAATNGSDAAGDEDAMDLTVPPKPSLGDAFAKFQEALRLPNPLAQPAFTTPPPIEVINVNENTVIPVVTNGNDPVELRAPAMVPSPSAPIDLTTASPEPKQLPTPSPQGAAAAFMPLPAATAPVAVVAPPRASAFAPKAAPALLKRPVPFAPVLTASPRPKFAPILSGASASRPATPKVEPTPLAASPAPTEAPMAMARVIPAGLQKFRAKLVSKELSVPTPPVPAPYNEGNEEDTEDELDEEERLRKQFFSRNVFLEMTKGPSPPVDGGSAADSSAISSDLLQLFLPDPNAPPSPEHSETDSSDDETPGGSSSSAAALNFLLGRKKSKTKDIPKNQRGVFADEGVFTDGTKIAGFLEILKDVPADDKIVVYSQFVTFLDLLEAKLRMLGHKFVRLDGKMAQKDRQNSIHRFNTKKSVRIFLISLRAGGLGINLVAANRVVLLDPWWNPALEQQAVDRVYRIGQRKPVHVYKLAIKDSVEERITKLQDWKKEIADSALSDRRDAGADNARLTYEDLKKLFKAPTRTR